MNILGQYFVFIVYKYISGESGYLDAQTDAMGCFGFQRFGSYSRS